MNATHVIEAYAALTAVVSNPEIYRDHLLLWRQCNKAKADLGVALRVAGIEVELIDNRETA